MIFTIASRELRSLFLSPLAWAILAVTLFILAYLFLTHIETYLGLQPRLAAIQGAPGVADIIVAPLLADAAMVLLLITPLITMRSISEERRNRTISLLFSAPLSMTEIVIGKYLGILSFFIILLALLALMPLSLLAGTDLDLGKLAAAVPGDEGMEMTGTVEGILFLGGEPAILRNLFPGANRDLDAAMIKRAWNDVALDGQLAVKGGALRMEGEPVETW